MAWLNADGLYVKFAKEEAALSPGGSFAYEADKLCIQFDISYLDVQSATPAILGSRLGSDGVQVPDNFRAEALEILVRTPFTSSGTIGTSTLVIGTKLQSDRSTDIDTDGLTTTAFVGSRLDGAGERTYIEPGATGAGDDYGVTTTANGLIAVSNSQHASHPFTAGSAICRLFGYIPANVPPQAT